MTTVILHLLVMLFTIYFMHGCYRDFRITRDPAYVLFFAVGAVLIIFLSYGFMHFKPWLN